MPALLTLYEKNFRTMKRLQMVTILTLLLSVIEGRVFAYDAIVDGIYYALLDSTAYVTYPLFPSNNNAYSGNIVIPETITYKGKSYVVDAIGGEAFHNCSGLTNVIIPSSVSSIGSGAFRNCSGLTSIIIPNSVKRINNNTFEGCTGLTDVTIPGSVNSIGLEAFEGCTSLMDIIIPESVLSIGSEAFKDCSSLASVSIPNSVTSIGYDAFKNTFIYTNSPDGVVFIDKWVCGYKGTMPSKTVITLQDGTMGIADNAFYGCSDLAGITIPNSVVSIGRVAFSGCSNMADLTIGSSVATIGSSAFGQCSSLTSISIPNSVLSIGEGAFYNCQNLMGLCIGEYVESIGNRAFDGCTSLKDVKVLVTDFYAFCNNTVVGMIKTQIGKPVVLINEDERVIEDYMVPVGVTSIGNSAFQNCINLSTITLPYSVVSIGQYAFWGCSNLISATIPSSVTSISGPSSFHNCYNLTVKVPVTDFYTFSNNNIIDLIRYNIGVPVFG